MYDRNDFQELRKLPPEVLGEVVREGELRLQSQLQAAIAADQRGLTFGGFQIASATAALGGGIALIAGDKNLVLAGIAIFFAMGILFGAFKSIDSVRPNLFDFPGNGPSGWLPSNWKGVGEYELNLTQARIEQAETLDRQIRENAECARSAAKLMHLSIDVTVWTTVFCGFLILMVLIFQAGSKLP